MKMKMQTVHKVRYHDVEETIKEVYKRQFDIPADLESRNDVCHEIHVDGKIDQYAKDEIEKWVKTGEGGFLTRSLMNDLCRLGHIPAGSYIIEVSW